MEYRIFRAKLREIAVAHGSTHRDLAGVIRDREDLLAVLLSGMVDFWSPLVLHWSTRNLEAESETWKQLPERRSRRSRTQKRM